jgi:23S rRNA G2445 N2-methylase RlmL
MCGAGTLLAEQLVYAERFRELGIRMLGGDIEFAAVRAAGLNLRRMGAPGLCQWDARRLPLASAEADLIVSNPPFGKQLSSPAEVGPLYRAMLREYDRVLRPGGQAVLLVSEADVLRQAAEAVGWHAQRRLRVRVLGQPAQISLWRTAG